MSSQLALPTALDELERRLRLPSSGDHAEVAQVLRVLQRFGLSRQELAVHIERLRAVNEVGDDLPEVEEACLQALDLVEGNSRHALEWSPAVTAAAWLPRCVTRADLQEALPYALAPSDLLPKRPQLQAVSVQHTVVERLWANLNSLEYEPLPAEFFRSPKTGLTTRPAALLAPQDRVIFESLAGIVGRRLDGRAPSQVVWPRTRGSHGAHVDFTTMPSDWQSEFVARTDIESFFEGVEHSVLAVVASKSLGLSGPASISLEAYLDCLMNRSLGLPQGPPGSDLLASAYLLDIDLELERRGWEFARYSDDYLIGCDSVGDARKRLRVLESLLLERGLRLSAVKTRVVRRSTYVRQLDRSSPRIEKFRTSIRDAVRVRLLESEDSEEVESLLEQAGADEEVIWGLMYHHTVSIEEVVEQLGDKLLPTEVDAYASFLVAAGEQLRDGLYPDQLDAEERDLRDCLLALSAAGRLVDLDVLNPILDWMPTLVKDIAFYLEVLSDDHPAAAADFIRRRHDSDRDSDLETAWLLSASLASTEVVADLVETLRLESETNLRPLSRTVAVRALALGGALGQETWDAAIRESPPALVAELLLALTSGSGIFPLGSPPRGVAGGG